MPTQFPTKDNETGKLHDVTYFDAGEVADMLHVSRRVVQRRCQAGLWPHMRLGSGYWFNADHVSRIVDIHTHDPHATDGHPVPPRRLGVVMDPDTLDDLEGLR